MGIVLIIVGALCALYGVSIMMLWSGTPFFAVWYVLGAAFVIWGWTMCSGLWSAAPAAARNTVHALCGVAVVVLLVTQGLALSAFNEHGDDNLDCLIVLGAQVRPDGPSIVLRYRLDTAYAYLAAHPQTRCVVSGGQGANEPYSEASVMFDYLVAAGIDPARIAVEDASLNTSENIENSLAFIDPATERIGIVTNNFHVFRGCAIARKKGIANVFGVAAPSSPWYLPNNLLRESFGITKDFVFGNI